MKEHYVLAIDVAKGKSMVSLIGSCGEVLISPYEINHNLNDFKNLDERIKKLNVFNDTAVIMESTGIYQMPVKRFFKENNYNLYVINPIYSKMYKQNLRKTKTDKEDCLNEASIIFPNAFLPNGLTGSCAAICALISVPIGTKYLSGVAVKFSLPGSLINGNCPSKISLKKIFPTVVIKYLSFCSSVKRLFGKSTVWIAIRECR